MPRLIELHARRACGTRRPRARRGTRRPCRRGRARARAGTARRVGRPSPAPRPSSSRAASAGAGDSTMNVVVASCAATSRATSARSASSPAHARADVRGRSSRVERRPPRRTAPSRAAQRSVEESTAMSQGSAVAPVMRWSAPERRAATRSRLPLALDGAPEMPNTSASRRSSGRRSTQLHHAPPARVERRRAGRAPRRARQLDVVGRRLGDVREARARRASAPPPRLPAARSRAWFTRMRRIIAGGDAEELRAVPPVALRCPARRRYASCTSAVGCSVWPGRSRRR